MTVDNIILEKFPGLDPRTAAGYGRTTNKFHKPKKLNSAFPYLEKGNYLDDDEYLDQELDRDAELMQKKYLNYLPSDFYSKNKSNPFYFVAGNVKLSDCFINTDDVLAEVHALGDSMSPIPTRGMKKSGSGAAVYSTSGNFSRTGSKRGYFSAPPEVAYKDPEDDEQYEEFYGIKDFMKILKKRSGE